MGLFEDQNLVSVEAVHYASDGTVKLNLSDKRELKLHAGVWADLGQPRDNPLTVFQLETLERESCYTMIRNKMLGFLAIREHSSMELRRKLKQSLYKSVLCDLSDLVERCLLEMQESDFQSDERFTRLFVESKLTNKLQGPFKILQDLQNCGISNELAQTVLNELSDQDIWMKKAVECLTRIQKNAKIQTQSSLSQKLYQRGFGWETIEKALEEYQNLTEHLDTGKFNGGLETLTTKNP